MEFDGATRDHVSGLVNFRPPRMNVGDARSATSSLAGVAGPGIGGAPAGPGAGVEAAAPGSAAGG
jgi:hypothetical protein